MLDRDNYRRQMQTMRRLQYNIAEQRASAAGMSDHEHYSS